ncbi:ROK family transcriptional regulator [Streptomyces sp. NBC_01497]|uniref:ROK family transcriptional regulator n=1 Tax=Streptomyces sp. NBC_01497 TaxID=2903885 RepID=UPI002E36D880|nr:ROK family transcriptional regulator [Streptomyces sp. NBC_01497]
MHPANPERPGRNPETPGHTTSSNPTGGTGPAGPAGPASPVSPADPVRPARQGKRPNDGAAGANLPVLRGHNTALVLDLLRTAGAVGISRLELAERTGLTPQAVSKITARLRADGTAAEAGFRASTGGKPRTVLRLVPGAAHAVGLHLDRDEVTAVLVDLAGHVVAVRAAPLDLGARPETVLDVAVEQVVAVRSEADGPVSGGSAADVHGSQDVPVPDAPRATDHGDPNHGATNHGAASQGRTGGRAAGGGLLGVGVAMPGPLDHTTGTTRRVTGFPHWDGFPLRDALAERLGLPVTLDKDTNAAALGLAARGGAGSDSFAYLHLGTGLGAGLVLNGALYRGARTGAGEFGHQVVQLGGPPCDCGYRGCLEAICLAAVARGDLATAAGVLGEGAANLVSLLDIDRVVLGGRTVAAHREQFVTGVARVLGARPAGRGPGAVPVTAAGDGERPVAEGAAHLLLAPVFGHRMV